MIWSLVSQNTIILFMGIYTLSPCQVFFPKPKLTCHSFPFFFLNTYPSESYPYRVCISITLVMSLSLLRLFTLHISIIYLAVHLNFSVIVILTTMKKSSLYPRVITHFWVNLQIHFFSFKKKIIARSLAT
jgi:hypothetical protein